jgi:hypothetical protein
VCNPNPKGLETPLNSAHPPAQNNPNQYKTNGAQSVRGFVPKKAKKMKKNWGDFGKIGFRVFVGKNGKWGEMVATGGAKRPAVVRWVVGK